MSRRLRLATIVVAASAAAGPLGAQGWSAQLNVAPLASPYLSDWEVDPSIGEVLVTNGTAADNDVTFHYSLTRNGQVLLRGVTDPQPVPAGQTVTFNATSTFGGRADWDRGVQDLVARTGRLPEGEYEACVTLTDPGGFVLVERQCVRFSAEYPDPPALVFPMNGDTITTQDPIFEWLPVQLPPAADGRLGYVLQIAEVNGAAGQRPEVALESNILHYVEPDLTETSHQYPVGGLPFVAGRTYAWRVQALDGDGRPVAANQGTSEIWTFVYREPQAEVDAVVASIVVTPRRDTLRFAGDTARYEATAYDADNLEIPGKRLAWRVLDSTVARVDTLGIVTGVGGGETQIVASAEGVADSALTVTAVPKGLAVRFERFDASTDTPALLELIQSGSFDEIIPKLMELLQSGELRIPIPQLPGVEAAQSEPGAPGGNDGAGDAGGGHGPSPGAGSARARRGAVGSCDLATADAVVHLDHDRKAWALQLAVTSTVVQCVQPGADPDSILHASLLLGVSWKHPGVPRVVLALKGLTKLPIALPLLGTVTTTSYVVVNPSRSVTLEAGLLPEDVEGFFGTESFDAGTGLTAYHKLHCVDAATTLCQILTAINPDNPDITLRMFAGVTASETSVNSNGLGHSLALGFSIQATLPVRTYDLDIGELSIDSTQVGLLFAVQDSMVEGTGVPRHNWSIGVAPTLAAWLSGSHGNVWEIDGSIGLEWDPTKETEALRPKLVVSAQLPQVWQLWWLRLGNPQLVFTTPIGSRREREATTAQLSGTWGFGPNEGVGVAAGGGDVRGDVGGGASGGVAGFEEAGRGQITFTWARPATEYTRETAKKARDDATSAVTKQLHEVRDARTKVDEAKKHLEWAMNTTQDEYAAAEKALREAESAYATASVQLVQLRADREKAREALQPPQCWKTVRGRCLNWSASLSVGNGVLLDLFAAIMRSGGDQ